MKRKIQNFTKVISTEFAGAVKEGKSYHLTPSPSPDRGEGGRVKSRLSFKYREAFTLAETLITVVILGIVAAILVPNLIKKQIESSNRTKIKKAMAAYENIISSIIIVNDIAGNADELDNWAKEENNTCSNAASFFKIAEKSNNSCQFKTSDGLWWDIGKNGKLSKAIVAFKKADLTTAKAMNESTFEAFYFITFFDDNNTARIIDMGYANQIGKTVAIINNAKVLAFVNNKNIYDYFNFCTDTKKSCAEKVCSSGDKCDIKYYDDEGKYILTRSSCDENGLNCSSVPAISSGRFPELANEKGVVFKYKLCDKQGDNCEFKLYYQCDATSNTCTDVNTVSPYLGRLTKRTEHNLR